MPSSHSKPRLKRSSLNLHLLSEISPPKKRLSIPNSKSLNPNQLSQKSPPRPRLSIPNSKSLNLNQISENSPPKQRLSIPNSKIIVQDNSPPSPLVTNRLSLGNNCCSSSFISTPSYQSILSPTDNSSISLTSSSNNLSSQCSSISPNSFVRNVSDIQVIDTNFQMLTLPSFKERHSTYSGSNILARCCNFL